MMLSFNILSKSSVLHTLVQYPRVLEKIVNETLVSEKDLPFVIFEDSNGHTPLDIAIEKK